MSKSSFTKLNNITPKKVALGISIVYGIYHILNIWFRFYPTGQHNSIHLTLALLIVLITSLDTEKFISIRNIVNFVSILGTVFVGYYMHTNYEILLNRVGFSTTMDTIVGLIIVCICLLACKYQWGNVIPSIVVVVILYGYFGHHLPGMWFHSGMSFGRLMGYSAMYFSGVYGQFTAVSSYMLFMFIMFGAVLEAAGGTNFFLAIAGKAGNNLRSGIGQVSIVGSALFGTINGTIAGNVATTGAITIPSMIKHKVKPEFAGAVEATASTGGQLMPPMMGLAIFLMVGFTGIPYVDILQAAVFPALVFYFYLVATLQIRALKQNWEVPEKSKVKMIDTLKQHGHLILPFIVLLYLLTIRYPAVYAAFWATIAMIAVAVARIIYDYRDNLSQIPKNILDFLFKAISTGAILSAKIAVSIATLGILVEIVVATGFAQTLSHNMVMLTGDNLLLLLILAAITCIFFGLGMATTPAYMMVALLSAPALVKLGVELLNAHLFVFYFAVLSSITPPVATGVLVATTIAKCNFWGCAKESLKLSLPIFVLPFYFVYDPAILWHGFPLWQVIISSLTILAGLVGISALYENYFLSKLSTMVKLLLIAGVILSFTPLISLRLLSLILIIIVFIAQYPNYIENKQLLNSAP